MKKAGSRILIITFGIMVAIAILYPWKFVPEYGILQMTESGEKAGKTAQPGFSRYPKGQADGEAAHRAESGRIQHRDHRQQHQIL